MERHLHKGQMAYALVSANSSVNICSRRWGKSYIVGWRIHENVLEMPGSLGVFVASSFRQAHSRTLPAALMALEDLFGWKRDVHYVVGKRPPSGLGFKEPLFCPSDLKDAIWFYNGTLMVVVSQEVTLSANSLTIHWMVADEAKGLDPDRLKDEVLPAIGGSNRWFNDPAKYPHLWGTHYFTDMPTAKSGLWLMERYEPMRDKKLYGRIVDLQRRADRLMANGGTPQYIEQLRREANTLRSTALYYARRPIFDNIEVVGSNYIARCQRDLSDAVYRTSILCEPMGKTNGAFYDSFDRRKHTYHATDNGKIDLGGTGATRYDCSFDTDVERNKPLAIAFDFGALINWVVVAQIQGDRHRTLNSFFVKDQSRLHGLVDLFCDYYAPHPNKTVFFYYDHTAFGQGYVESGHDAYNIVRSALAKRGWFVRDMYIGRTMSHNSRFKHVNDGFAGNNALLPELNADTNPELIEAMEKAEWRKGKYGVEKDKSGENTPEGHGKLPYELRTDATDAWDTNYIGCLMKPYDGGGFVWV